MRARSTPCDNCPFIRGRGAEGFLGTADSPEDYYMGVHYEVDFPCHKSLYAERDRSDNPDASPDSKRVEACAGADLARAALCKLPRDPDMAERVKSKDGRRACETPGLLYRKDEFVNYHEGHPEMEPWEEGDLPEECDLSEGQLSEVVLARSFGFRATSDARRGHLWCKFRKEDEHIWQAGKVRPWVRATLEGDTYRFHKGFKSLEEALRNEKGKPFGPDAK